MRYQLSHNPNTSNSELKKKKKNPTLFSHLNNVQRLKLCFEEIPLSSFKSLLIFPNG